MITRSLTAPAPPRDASHDGDLSWYFNECSLGQRSTFGAMIAGATGSARGRDTNDVELLYVERESTHAEVARERRIREALSCLPADAVRVLRAYYAPLRNADRDYGRRFPDGYAAVVHVLAGGKWPKAGSGAVTDDEWMTRAKSALRTALEAYRGERKKLSERQRRRAEDEQTGIDVPSLDQAIGRAAWGDPH